MASSRFGTAVGLTVVKLTVRKRIVAKKTRSNLT